MRSLLAVAVSVVLCSCSSFTDKDLWNLPPDLTGEMPTVYRKGKLRVEIQRPASDLRLTGWESSIEVEGGASLFGGVKFLDLMFVLDTSRSLRRTDPEDFRSRGAASLVESLPAWSDIHIGVVGFDQEAELVLPLTADRAAAVEAFRGLDQSGQTDLAAGIRTALKELDRGARPDSSRVIMLFTDGKSSAKKARRAMEEARGRGVAIHTLLLGSSEKGTVILRGIAAGTGGSFVGVTDPAMLPEAFMNLRTTGVEGVTLRVSGSPSIPTRLIGGTFSGLVPLRPGENRIVATATSLDGDSLQDEVTVTLTGDVAVSIDSPVDGAVVTHRDTEIVVEGEVDPFVGLPSWVHADSARLGTRSVALTVEDSPPVLATVADGRWRGTVHLRQGDNRIAVVATTLDGRTAGGSVSVTVRSKGCAELKVSALREGRPTLSISDREVEIVFDASNSMWARMEGRPKINVAKDSLTEALDALPQDLGLALRVYGHRHPRELRNCTDTELLVPFGAENREPVREAIASFRPRGQSPLAYSLGQVAEDFGDLHGERAVVLVTDGIESCGGDPERAARALGDRGIPVHVIGFGLGNDVDEDLSSLKAIASASGGRFLTATSGQELRDALAVTVGTAFQVLSGDVAVAEGALGAEETIRLPEGRYRVRLDSAPPHEVLVDLVGEETVALVLEREGGTVSDSVTRGPAEYSYCRVAPSAPVAGKTGPN